MRVTQEQYRSAAATIAHFKKAMITVNNYKFALIIVELYKAQVKEDRKNNYFMAIKKKVNEKKVNNRKPSIVVNKDTKLIDAGLSVKAIKAIEWNRSCLGFGNLKNVRVKHLSKLSKSKLLQMRGFGERMLVELESFCFNAGVTMRP